jgi:hypothetical protein
MEIGVQCNHFCFSSVALCLRWLVFVSSHVKFAISMTELYHYSRVIAVTRPRFTKN